MPPKKDDKKGKKGAAGPLKEVDPQLFVRKPVQFNEIKDIPPLTVPPNLTGIVANVEALFPEWSIEGEVWTEAIPDGPTEITYPKNLNITGTSSLIAYYGLEPVEVAVDPKAKPVKKEAPKKGAKEVEVELKELFENENGKPLPVMIKESGEEFKGTIFSRDFFRHYTDEQKKLKLEQDELHTHIEELKLKKESLTSEHEKEEIQRQILKLEHTLHKSQAHVNMDKDTPSGYETDPYVTAAFRTVLRYAPAIINSSTASSDSSDAAVSGETASAATPASELNENYLWRAIYPKLPNGKPYYNVAGKYAVKLFLAGKWRKVYVNDQIPLGADGFPALSRSTDNLELWPMILAKAIYTVYSACGYTKKFDDITEGSQDIIAVPTPSAHTVASSYRVSQFVSFAVHLLTGWQPNVPLPVNRIFLHEKSRAGKLIESIFMGGTTTILHEDIVNDEPTSRNLKKFHSYAQDRTVREQLLIGTDCTAGSDGTVQEVLKTKKQFQLEYQQRKERRDAIIAAILLREERIADVTKRLATIPLNELYFLSLFDSERNVTRVLPILGVVHPDTGSNLLEYKLLVEWRTLPAEEIPEQIVSIEGVLQKSVLNPHITHTSPVMRRDDETPLPHSTPLIYEYISIQQLVDGNAYLIAANTNIHTPFAASFARHWQPLVPTNSIPEGSPTKGKKDAAPKGKDKGAPVVAAAPSQDTICGDEGAAPITLLTLDCSSFFAQPQSTTTEGGEQKQDKQPKTEEEEALAAQQQELDSLTNLKSISIDDNPDNNTPLTHRSTSSALSAFSRPNSAAVSAAAALKQQQYKEDYVFLSVLLHADMVSKPPEPVAGEGGAAENPTPVIDAPLSTFGDVAGAIHSRKFKLGSAVFKKKTLPSDVVLILQEFRTDDVDPLMYIIEMKDDCYLPVTRKTFGIPRRRLPANPNEPMVFWVRLFSKSSLFIQFNSTVKMAVGDAEKIWAGLGRPLYVSEGDSGLTREHTQQLLFRMPLVAEEDGSSLPAGSVGTTNDNKAAAATDVKQTEDPSAVSTDANDLAILARVTGTTVPCMSFLYISDREVEKNVSLAILNNTAEGDNEYATLNYIQGNILNLNTAPKHAHTLIGQVYSKGANGNTTVRPFHWKLLLLSPAVPIVSPSAKPINEEAVTQRFTGKYYANNKLALFRDVITVDKSSFPIALRLTTTPIIVEAPSTATDADPAASAPAVDGPEASAPIPSTEDIYLVVRVYRKSDKSLVSTFKGKQKVVMYSQVIDSLLNEGEEAGAATASAGKKDKAAAPAKGKGAPVVESIDLIIECTLDECHEEMDLLSQFKSRFPHNFDVAYEPVAPVIEDVKGGKSAGTLQTSEPIAPINGVIENQKACLTLAPPTVAQFNWQLDILAGKVINISHDTADLERAAALKNAWEERTNGRTERAAAALAYYQERKKQELSNEAQEKLNNASASAEEKRNNMSYVGGGRHVASSENKAHIPLDFTLTTTMAESLSVALNTTTEAEKEEVVERYKLIHKLPKFAPFVDFLGDDGTPPADHMLIPPETDDPEVLLTATNLIHAEAEARRAQEKIISEQKFTDISNKFIEFNLKLREETKQQMTSLVKVSFEDAVEMSKLWEAREQYRLEAAERNASLKYMLTRGKEAQQKARDIENGVDDTKGKKGAKKK